MAADEAAQVAYDEAHCIAALAQLERLKSQLDGLRLTIPRIVKPFHLPSDPAMFHAFKRNLMKAQSDMKTFRSQWQSQETQSIFEHARESAIANPDLSAGAQVQLYGWVEKEQRIKETAKANGNGGDGIEDSGVHITEEERERVMGEWKKAHPSIRVEERDDGKELLIPLVSDANKFRFRVTIPGGANTMRAIKAECEGTAEPFAAVTRCLASRPNANDLKYLLDMIASYKTVEGSSCAKCNRTLDDDATTPVARRSRVVGANNIAETVWAPFHEGCLN